jgi:hypothetical protein
MGGGKKSSKVKSPDPNEIIRTQAKYNRINQYTPFGSLTFSSANGGLNNVATQTLSPELQQIFGLQTQGSQQALEQALAQQALLPQGLPNYSLQNPNYDNPIAQRSLALLRPDMELDEARFMQDLENRGIPVGSEAFNNAQRQFMDNQNRIRERIALESAMQDIGLQQQNRAQSFNEVAARLGQQQVQIPGLSGFFSPGSMDVAGAHQLQQNAQSANAQIAAQGRSDLLSGLFGLGSSAILGGLFG